MGRDRSRSRRAATSVGVAALMLLVAADTPRAQNRGGADRAGGPAPSHGSPADGPGRPAPWGTPEGSPPVPASSRPHDAAVLARLAPVAGNPGRSATARGTILLRVMPRMTRTPVAPAALDGRPPAALPRLAAEARPTSWRRHRAATRTGWRRETGHLPVTGGVALLVAAFALLSSGMVGVPRLA